MLEETLTRHKKRFQQYNSFRKAVFRQLTPKESDVVLHLVPWLLSVNHPLCPGFIPDLKKPFKIYGIENQPEIAKREPEFKRRFKIIDPSPLLALTARFYMIQGLYTIGSVGTVSQTPLSDCDIWVCYDQQDIDQVGLLQLNQKINLVKDWLDLNLRMPIYFFLSSIDDIKKNHFGNMDSESSGSTQRNILKEEFYRTSVLICGKVPLWWIACDDGGLECYEPALTAIAKQQFDGRDIIDMGSIQEVPRYEYFGSALWQLHKSLTFPLKSIFKMILLKMLLQTAPQRLICDRLREMVLVRSNGRGFPDPAVFTIHSLFAYYAGRGDTETLKFLNECFYLRCNSKSNQRQTIIKNKLFAPLLKKYAIDARTKRYLDRYAQWDFGAQISLGHRLIELLSQSYGDIAATHCEEVSEIDQQEVSILGRKIAACYKQRLDKIPVLPKPSGELNLSDLTFSLQDRTWFVFVGTDRKTPLVSHNNIMFCIAFIVWNNLLEPARIRMAPNSSSVTLQEIINLGLKMRDFFGVYDISAIEFTHFLKEEHPTKVLVSVSFEKSTWEKDINDFGVIYKNNWGEGYVKRFSSPYKLESFLRKYKVGGQQFETSYYLQRNCMSYEKIIERTKRIIQVGQGRPVPNPAQPPAELQEDLDVLVERRVRRLKNYISRMPSLSTTATKVIEICNRPTTSPNDLNRVISLDPILTGHVLRLVNSAYHYLFNRVTSLTRAIIMLGINTVKNLALSKAIFEIIGEKEYFRALKMDIFWTHSITVGVTAKSIAAIKGIPLAELEEYFVAGLLHDLGKIPLNNRFPDEYSQALESRAIDDGPMHRAENLIFGIDHCMVGKLIAEKWQLNETMMDSLGCHHDWRQAGEENQKLVSIVALADAYANSFENGNANTDPPENPIMNRLLDDVDIEWSALLELRGSVEKEIENAKAFLNKTKKR